MGGGGPPRIALLIAPAVLVAVVAVAVAGRTTDRAVDVVSAATAAVAAALAAEPAPPRQAAAVTPSPRSDWPAAIAERDHPRTLTDRVNKFTIDDIRAASPTFDTTPPWVRRPGR